MAKPWADAGYLCYCVDIQHPAGEQRDGNIVRVGVDMLRWLPPRYRVKICFGFPPCTHLAVSGARWFKSKGVGELVEGLTLFARAIELMEWIGAPFMLENPTSVVSSHWRKPDQSFDPWQYTRLCIDDNYSKLTCLWTGAGFKMPKPQPDSRVTAAVRIWRRTMGKKGFGAFKKNRSRFTDAELRVMDAWLPDDRIHAAPPSDDRADFRSATPMGFARAVFDANHGLKLPEPS